MSITQISDNLIPDQETEEQKQARLNRLEIAELKAKLKKTDYIAAKLAEGAAKPEEYAEELAQRAEWRARINELEDYING